MFNGDLFNGDSFSGKDVITRSVGNQLNHYVLRQSLRSINRQRNLERAIGDDFDLRNIAIDLQQGTRGQETDARLQLAGQIADSSLRISDLSDTIDHHPRCPRRLQPLGKEDRVQNAIDIRSNGQLGTTDSLSMTTLFGSHLEDNVATESFIALNQDGTGERCAARPLGDIVFSFRIDRERRLHGDCQQDREQVLRDISFTDHGLPRYLQHHGPRSSLGCGRQFDLHVVLSGRDDRLFGNAHTFRQSINPQVDRLLESSGANRFDCQLRLTAER